MELTGVDFATSTRAAEDRTKMERGCCKDICGAPNNLASFWYILDILLS